MTDSSNKCAKIRFGRGANNVEAEVDWYRLSRDRRRKRETAQ